MRIKGIMLSAVVILVSNAVALISVALNHKGELIRTIELTERELVLQRQAQDNSGVSLRLDWVNHWHDYPQDPAALTAPFDLPKLQELGFDCPDPVPGADKVRRPLPREVYIALEYDGPAWNAFLQGREREDKLNELKKHPNRFADTKMSTRLLLVDASRSFEQLQARYPDPRRHLIARGIVAAAVQTTRDRRQWRGSVSQILPSDIHVPLPFASALSHLDPKRGEAPRYVVTLSYGRRLEPWIAAIRIQ
jgi:hypothetical protein